MTARLAALWMLMACLTGYLGGCGFHLRGNMAMPAAMSVTYIQSEQHYSTLTRDFRTAFRAYDMSVTDERSLATAVLRVLGNQIEQAVLSVNTAGKVQEYEIRQTLTFSVTTRDNAPLIDEQTVTLSRAYVFSSSDVLGKQREDRVLRESLQRDLVNLALLRISAAAKAL
ncbi:MAG: LPS assembly lipoprotein LptE [Gammaproteobacteria bacterium]